MRKAGTPTQPLPCLLPPMSPPCHDKGQKSIHSECMQLEEEGRGGGGIGPLHSLAEESHDLTHASASITQSDVLCQSKVSLAEAEDAEDAEGGREGGREAICTHRAQSVPLHPDPRQSLSRLTRDRKNITYVPDIVLKGGVFRARDCIRPRARNHATFQNYI